MARARNIKPAFFDNDELAEIEPVGRLLFIGLWTIADCKGDIVWREKRIKAQLLPYDNCDIKKLAINLDKSGFVRFYSDGDKMYLNIVNFLKHQNPHKNEREKGSEIPSFSDSMRQAVDLKGLTINRDKSGLKPDDSNSNRADSLLLIPDPLSPITESCETESKKPQSKKYNFSDEDYRCAEWFYQLVKNVAPKTKKPNLEAWANDIRLIRVVDGITYQEISGVFMWANKDPFWSLNILSPPKFRKQFAQLQAKSTSTATAAKTKTSGNLSACEDFING